MVIVGGWVADVVLDTKYNLFVGTKPEVHKTYPHLL